MLRTVLAPVTLATLLICTIRPTDLRAQGPANAPSRPASQSAPKAPAAVEGGIAVFFSPDGGALEAIVDLIGRSRKSIDVQAYMLTTKELPDPLAEAHQRGVKVRVLLDADNAGPDRGLGATLAAKGVAVFTDGEHKEAHDK